jgi:precorrin-6B methylase 2
MSAQDRTLEQYHQLMQINAASHLIRIARRVGILGELRDGQRTHEQLCEALSLEPGLARELLSALVAIGIVERYESDFALSRAAHLLCQYDVDLGDARWERLTDLVQGTSLRQGNDDQLHFDHLAAAQWIHTPTAMEAAEVLDIGGEGEQIGPAILDLGCGSAVWSCAAAFRDPKATVTAVDNREALVAAASTASSIELMDRFTAVEGDPMSVELADEFFDWVMIPQRVNCLGHEAAVQLLKRACAATKPGGRVVVIDLFRSPTKANLSECVESLKLETETRSGSVRTLAQIEAELREAGLGSVQIAFLSKSKANLGLAVAVKPVKTD